MASLLHTNTTNCPPGTIYHNSIIIQEANHNPPKKTSEKCGYITKLWKSYSIKCLHTNSLYKDKHKIQSIVKIFKVFFKLNFIGYIANVVSSVSSNYHFMKKFLYHMERISYLGVFSNVC